MLHYAVEKKQPQMLSELFKIEPKCKQLINAVSDFGSPLVAAASKGCIEAAQLLLAHKADVSVSTEAGVSALSAAFKANQAKLADQLIRAGAKLTGTAVYEASMHGESNLDELVQSQSGWVNSSDMASGKSALHLASIAGDTPLVKFLCESGADVNMGTKREAVTPLMSSSRYGHKGCTRCLLQFKASVDAGDNNGDTPLHYAGWFEKSKVFQILVEVAGASPEALNKKGEKPKSPDSPDCCIQ